MRRRCFHCRGFFDASNRSTRLIRSPFSTTREIRSVALMSCVGSPSTTSRLASWPAAIRPMRRIGAQQLRGVAGRRLQRDRRRDAGLDPQLHLAVDGRAVEHQHVAGVAAGDQRHAGLPGAAQVVLRDADRAVDAAGPFGVRHLAFLDRRRGAGQQLLRDRLLHERAAQQVGASRREIADAFQHRQRRIVGDARLRHPRQHRVRNRVAERSVLDARRPGIDGILDVARVAGVNRRRQMLRVGFFDDRAEHRQVHAGEQHAGAAALEHRLDRVDADGLQLPHLLVRLGRALRRPHELIQRRRLRRSLEPREVFGAVAALGGEQRPADEQLGAEQIAVRDPLAQRRARRPVDRPCSSPWSRRCRDTARGRARRCVRRRNPSDRRRSRRARPMWTCTSISPGITVLPDASTTSAFNAAASGAAPS